MRRVVLTLAALVLPMQLAAQGMSDIEFSATAVQSLPENRTMTGKLYNSKGRVRQEMTQGGQTRVTINDLQQNVGWVLNPDRKEYVEVKGPPPGGTGERPPPSRMPLPDDPAHPCQQQSANLRCTRLGTEPVAGRPADKWEFVATQNGETYKTVVWVDQRLRMPIRMEMPGGMSSELRDIKEGPQPPELFTVPSDYKRVEMPQSAAPGQGQGQPAPEPSQPNR
jgi:hypothetical protein